ncbi:MAG: integration host factor subunit alpha [Nitrospirae bacterium]|nr:integration host factor subunit alpha [Nitrospirota bacterium]
MNRNDIVDYALKSGGGDSLPRKTVRAALDFLVQEITETLLSGESVKLSGFGTFEVRRRADRMGRNPKTGDPLLIPGHRVVVFRPTRRFLDAGEKRPSREAAGDSWEQDLFGRSPSRPEDESLPTNIP